MLVRYILGWKESFHLGKNEFSWTYVLIEKKSKWEKFYVVGKIKMYLVTAIVNEKSLFITWELGSSKN